jgi:3-oxosteroid 1-dehydrogenase
MSQPKMDEQFDMVIVGSGGGSMCAALYMTSIGRSALILEKTELIGGSTARSGGVMWIPNNRFMRAEGVPDSEEEAMTYLNAVIKDSPETPGTSPGRRLTYVREGAAMVDFLVQQGIRLRRIPYYPDYYDDLPGGSKPGRTVVAELFNVNELGAWKTRLRPSFLELPGALDEFFVVPTYKRSWKGRRMLARILWRGLRAKLTGKHWVTAGAALQGRLLQAAVKAGVDIRTEAPVRELILEQGRVVGVVTLVHGQPRRIGAREAVLLNAGGFAHNQEMRDRYMPGTRSEWSNSPPGDTGDMHREGQRIGAALAQMEERVGNQMSVPPGHQGLVPMVQMELAKPHAILVDQGGARYMNEGGSYMQFCQGMLQRNQKTPAVPSWMVFDSQFVDKYTLLGTMPGTKKPQAWYDCGFLHRAATLEDLAKSLSIEPALLVRTIERFNALVRKNHDDDFHRGARAYDEWLGDPLNIPSATLGAIEKGPFYAVPVVPGDVGTFGGLVTDECARVLDQQGAPIPGLYATGNTTASVMARMYPGAGSSVGPSLTWGYVAAKHAAAQVRSETEVVPTRAA